MSAETTRFNGLTFALVDNLVALNRPSVMSSGADDEDGMNELVRILLDSVDGPDVNVGDGNFGLACIAAAAIRRLAIR